MHEFPRGAPPPAASDAEQGVQRASLPRDALAAWVPTLLLERRPAKGMFSAEIGKAKGRKLCPSVLHPTGAGEELQGRQLAGWC